MMREVTELDSRLGRSLASYMHTLHDGMTAPGIVPEFVSSERCAGADGDGHGETLRGLRDEKGVVPSYPVVVLSMSRALCFIDDSTRSPSLNARAQAWRDARRAERGSLCCANSSAQKRSRNNDDTRPRRGAGSSCCTYRKGTETERKGKRGTVEWVAENEGTANAGRTRTQRVTSGSTRSAERHNAGDTARP